MAITLEDVEEKYPNIPSSVFKAEGDELYIRREYKKALEAYTRALVLKEKDKECLVRRSKCFLGLGDSTHAFNDAESALLIDPQYYQALYQKAEALYARGEFEQALVFYHRGNKLRPNMESFKMGISKAKEAIHYSVGDYTNIKLTKEGDLSFFAKLREKPKPKRQQQNIVGARLKTGDDGKTSSMFEMCYMTQGKYSSRNRTTKQLLGELYGDRLYLENLLKETDATTDVGSEIHGLVCEGLVYLDKKTNFWRQQHPLYSRHPTAQQRKRQASSFVTKLPDQFVIREMEKIDQMLNNNRFEDCIKRAKRTLATVENLADGALHNREDVVASLHCCLGNAYMELGIYKLALQHHKLDKQIGEQHDLELSKSRALDNIGRCYARTGEYRKAIDVWLQKVPRSQSDLERLWLYHEIGRCYLELGQYQLALEYGFKAMEYVPIVNDGMWEINCVVLMGQAQLKLGDLSVAVNTFERALALTTIQGDKAAEVAVRRALHEVNVRIVDKIKEEEEKEDALILAQIRAVEEARAEYDGGERKRSLGGHHHHHHHHHERSLRRGSSASGRTVTLVAPHLAFNQQDEPAGQETDEPEEFHRHTVPDITEETSSVFTEESEGYRIQDEEKDYIDVVNESQNPEQSGDSFLTTTTENPDQSESDITPKNLAKDQDQVEDIEEGLSVVENLFDDLGDSNAETTDNAQEDDTDTPTS